MPPIPEFSIDQFPVVIEIPVQWGDQDAFGHVNNTWHIRWFESARVAYLDRIAFGMKTKDANHGPILASINCNYRRQLAYPDTVHIGARITRVGNTSVIMQNAVFSNNQHGLIADGESVIVMFDYDAGKPMPVPDAVRTAIANIEGIG